MQTARERRPGESLFGVLMLLLSLFILWTAHGISGFEALSSPGAFPMAAGAVMVVASCVSLLRTFQSPAPSGGETFFSAILPPVVAVFCGLVAVFSVLLDSAGFLIAAFSFLIASIWYLHKRGAIPALLLALLSIVVIYVVFRLIFRVVLPEGIVPEREIIAAVTRFFTGGSAQ